MKTVNTKTAPQAKSKVSKGVAATLPTPTLVERAMATYNEIMSGDAPPTPKRVLIGMVLGFVASAAVIYASFAPIFALMLIVETATGFAFLGFLAGVLAVLLTWWVSAKVGAFVNDVITARVVERGASRMWHSVRGVFTPSAA